MIQTLSVTILIEGIVCLGYSIWQKKPSLAILLTSILANLITQSLLWISLDLFFQHYLATLWVAEILIWIMESALLYGFRVNHLSPLEALGLSLLMNLSSFGIGWFLPV
ncbi:MAG TPA: hypothetical protein VN653_12460 [Anaerolineales bacterium]|nr:hypothetical protein [Anaerolineales bacterium]